jgi:hypothetical protein
MYGVKSDPIMMRIARRSQAAFNIVTVMEPQMHDWDLTYEGASRNRGAMQQRKNFDPLFIAVFNNLGYFVSMDGSRAVGEESMITLGDAALKYEPLILHAIMLNDPGIAAAPMFASQVLVRHLMMPDIATGLLVSQNAMHRVKEPA